MKIVMVNKYYHPAGGPEEVVLRTSQRLESYGHTVIPFSMQHPRNLASKYEDYFVSPVDYNHHSKLPWNLVRTASRIVFNPQAKTKMERLINDVRPDVVHLHNIYHQLSPSILLPLKKHGIPVVMTLHDFKLLCPNYTFMRGEKPCEECSGKHFHRAVRHRCVKNSYLKSAVSALEMYVHRLGRFYTDMVDRFIALSRFSQQKLIQYGLPSEKVTYLPNCTDIPVCNTQPAHERYILFLGALSDKNGAFNLVKAMRHLPAVRLKMAGEGEQAPMIQNYIRENAMHNVELLGFITGRELERTMSDCEFLVFPSNCYHNCPMSVLQCFARGKPVIGSNLGSIPELVRNGVTGLLSEPGDETTLAEAILLLWQRPHMTGELGRNARKMVEREFSPDRHYSKLLEIYQELIRNRKSEDRRSGIAC